MNKKEAVDLTDKQLERYSRHILLNQLDYVGQKKICNAKVLMMGAGGLGSPVALYLIAAGIGELAIVDFDVVELNNLQRQIAHSEKNIKMNKALSLKKSGEKINTEVQIHAFDTKLNDLDLLMQINQADAVVDCTDNIETRLQINRLCCEAKVPLVSGAAIQFEGQLTVFDFRNKDSACYACLCGDVENMSRSCSQEGVFSPLVGVVGASQVVETIKIITGIGDLLTDKLAMYNALTAKWTYIRYKSKPNCAVCQKTTR